MNKPTIALVNRSSKKDSDIAALVNAYQTQVTRDFYPIWGTDAKVIFSPGPKAPKEAWWLVFSDSSDEAGALGYHDITPAGLPLGKVFTKTTEQNGGLVSITGSHEILEMLADPWISEVIFIEEEQRLYAKEVCDAPEDDRYAYVIDGVKVSDFVTPDWFRPGRKGVPFDFCKHIKAPLQLLPGGYIGIYDLAKGSWDQITNDRQVSYHHRPRVGSRRERRRTRRVDWLRSAAT